MLATAVNWTTVLVTGVPAIIAAMFSGVALVIVSLNRRQLRTPSGDTIGQVSERAEHIAHATNASVRQLHERLNGENVLPAKAPNG